MIWWGGEGGDLHIKISDWSGPQVRVRVSLTLASLYIFGFFWMMQDQKRQHVRDRSPVHHPERVTDLCFVQKQVIDLFLDKIKNRL